MKKDKKVGKIISKIFVYAFLVIMAFVIIIPFYWMLNTSFKTSNEAEKEIPTLYPHEWTFENYRIAFLGKRKNTLINIKKREKELEKNLIPASKAKMESLREGYDNHKADLDALDSTGGTAKYLADFYEIIKPGSFYDTFKVKDAEFQDKLAEVKVKETSISTKKNIDLKAVVKEGSLPRVVFLEGSITKLEETLSHTTDVNEKAKLQASIDANKAELDSLITDRSKYDQIMAEIKSLQDELVVLRNEASTIESTYLTKEKREKFNKIEKEILTKDANLSCYTEEYKKHLEPVRKYKEAESQYNLLKKELEQIPTQYQETKIAPKDGFGKYFLNTLIVGIASTILGTFLSIIGAFALSRLKFKGRDVVFILMMATMMIPGEMMVISNYITVSKLGWVDGAASFKGAPFLSMIVPFLVTVFHVYLLRQNFKQIPNELYYAAKIDGTSDFKYLWKVMVPLAKSSIITITILKLMGSWNAYIWPNLVAGDEHKLITVWLRTAFQDLTTGRVLVEQQMAGTVVVLIPLLLVFILLRSYIMRGVARGGTKG